MQNGFSPAWTLKSVKTEYPNDGFGLPSKTDYPKILRILVDKVIPHISAVWVNNSSNKIDSY